MTGGGNSRGGRTAGNRQVWMTAAVAIVGLAWYLAVLQPSQDGGEDPVQSPTFLVRRGPLTISVMETGTIKAREQAVITNEIEGKTTILYLVPEGSHVEKGDLLVELDATRLQDQLLDQQILVQNGEAALIRARENLAVIRNQAESDTESADLALRFAEEDLSNYVEGEFPKELKEAEARIAVAQEELQRAEEKLTWSEVLFKEEYISQSELQADRLATKKARLDLDLAEGARDLLKDFMYHRRLAELESAVKQGRLGLERARRKASADVVQAEAELRAKESELRRAQSKYRKLEEQIEKARLTAPTAGLVVYATTAEFSWRGNTEPLAEGQEVREKQALIYLPTASSVMAQVKIHESALDKVRVGLPATITVDAVPGRTFSGTVASISPLPDAQSVWLNPDLKLYTTDIHIDGDGSALRTGMSCRAEIIVTRYRDAVYVPVQAVVSTGGYPAVYVEEGGSFVPRRVRTGLENNSMVQILDGLDPGEKVLLAPPLSAGVGEEPEDDGEEPDPAAEGDPV